MSEVPVLRVRARETDIRTAWLEKVTGEIGRGLEVTYNMLAFVGGED